MTAAPAGIGGFGPVRSHRLSAWDGLPLHALEWHTGAPEAGATPLLCLPGLVRTAGDFAALGQRFAGTRRVVAIDYPGRGASGRVARDREVARYGPEACLRDVQDICAALHLERVAAIGTSFGGLLAMGLAAARPGLLAGVVLNDVGPEIGTAGAAFVRRFVAEDPALEDLDACAAHLRRILPPLSLADAAAWRAMAALTYASGADGRWHPLWDTRIARLLDAPTPDLWPLFGAMAHLPLLLVRGMESNILSAETAARMQASRPDMELVAIPGVGHAPTLGEPAAVAAIGAFLGRLDAACGAAA